MTTQNDLVPLFHYSGFVAETRFQSDCSSIKDLKVCEGEKEWDNFKGVKGCETMVKPCLMAKNSSGHGWTLAEYMRKTAQTLNSLNLATMVPCPSSVTVAAHRSTILGRFYLKVGPAHGPSNSREFTPS